MAANSRPSMWMQAHRSDFESALERMNALVLFPCEPKPRAWWSLWLYRPKQHNFVDMTPAMNTLTYTIFERCDRCGLCQMFNGL